MSIIRITTAFNIDLEFEIAPFHKRLLAYLIDFVLLIIYLLAMKSLLYDGLNISREGNVGFDMLVISLPMLLYSLLFELWLNGQTIGKKLMAIRVISLDGGEPTLGQYILRWITKFFEWPFLFGYMVYSERSLYMYIFITGFFGIAVIIIISATKKSQRLGDLSAGTVVVDTTSSLSIADTVFMDVSDQNYKVQFPEVMRLSDSDINTIKTVIIQSKKRNSDDMSYRVEAKVKQVLAIQSSLSPNDFLEKLLEDYNYLATKE
ncbi:MAG: RDD family protein [Ferruginibacter sp.]|nr:RDD family protein [Ferruginibacter sp.]